MYTVKKIEGTWCVLKNGQIVDGFDTRDEAELLLFDCTRKWQSLYDSEAGS